MKIRFYVTGSERKTLVMAISELTGWEAVYMKTPTFAYVVNNYTIDKDGTLTFNERTPVADVHRLLEGLAERGYTSDDVFDIDGSGAEESAPAPAADIEQECDGGPSSMDTPDKLCIDVPLDGFTDTAFSNLEWLVESKAALIRKSIGTDSLEIEQTGDRLSFGWFPVDASQDEVAAYTQFVAALCDMAKTQKRVTAKEKPVDSEKFAFRCFLLRLGFIGAEYASARKLLLKNLSGDSSFRSGKRTAQDAPTASEIAGNGVSVETLGTSSPDLYAAENGANSPPEALADAELVHSVNALFEAER